MGYTHISISEREIIMVGQHLRQGVREVARRLGRAPSTISREIARNDRGRGYRAHLAQQRAEERGHVARRPRKTAYGPLRLYIDEKLKTWWAPEQISGRLEYEKAPLRMQVCHETIYRYVLESARIGADVATMPPAVIKGLVKHVLTDKGIEGFLADWAKTGQTIIR